MEQARNEKREDGRAVLNAARKSNFRFPETGNVRFMLDKSA